MKYFVGLLRIICFASLLTLMFCKSKSDDKFEKLEKLDWLIGTWEQKLPDGILIESWTKENDSTFLGKNLFINEKDTIHAESIVLTQKNDKLLYISTVNGQNNDEPTTFTLTLDADNTVSFENQAHDYPQKITYRKVSSNRLIATISGLQQGKTSQESYSMAKK